MERYNCIWETKYSENVADPGRNYHIFPEMSKDKVTKICSQSQLKLDASKLPFTQINSDAFGLSGGIHGNTSWIYHKTLSDALNDWIENHQISYEEGEYNL